MRVPLIPSACPLQVLVEFSDDPFIASVVKTALTAARPTGLLASEIEIEIEILAYEQGLVLTLSLQQPESDEIGPRSSDETAYGRRHLPHCTLCTPHHPLRSQWRTCPPRRILCSRSGCLHASY